MTDVRFIKLSPDAVVPSYARLGDAGADLSFCGKYSVTLFPRERCLFTTGIAVAMPDNWVGLIHPRSGLASKKGLSIVNAPGTVDSGYRGQLLVNLINLGADSVTIKPGDRIAQIIFQQFERANFVEVVELDETVRGINGHGSTGGN